MRRCQAPSQVARRYGLDTVPSPATPENSRNRKRVKYNDDDEDEDDDNMDTRSPVRTPLSLMTNAQRAPMIGSCSPISSGLLSSHEALIK